MWCGNKGHPKENKKRLFTQSLQGSQPSPLLFGRDSKAGSGVGKLLGEGREGFRYALIRGRGMRKL